MVRCSCRTSLPSTLRSPKTIAPVGHACWQAVWTVPSTMELDSAPDCVPPARTHLFLVAIFACWMRCVQKEHFSMTPRMRTVTSGLNCILVQSFGPSLR